MPVTVRSGNCLAVYVGVEVNVAVDTSVAVIDGVAVELGVLVGTTTVSGIDCTVDMVGVDVGTLIAVPVGFMTIGKTFGTTAIPTAKMVAITRMIANMTCIGSLGLRLFATIFIHA